MSYLAKNNSYGLLAVGLSSGAVSMTLQSGQGDRFPVIANPDYTFVTLEDAAGNREIVKVTARVAASDVMTIVRAQEGTVARAWNIGDVVELRMVASLVQTAMGHPQNTSTAHNASAIVVAPVGNLASNNVQAALAELDSEKQPAFDTLGFANGGTGATTRAGAVAALGIEAAEITVLTTANATTDIGNTAGTNVLLTTGAITITGFAAAPTPGVWRSVRVSTGGITLAHSATFVLPGAANIVTAAGDCFEAFYTGAAWLVRKYQRADGKAIVNPDPSGFNVNYANSAGSASTANNATYLQGYVPGNFAAASHSHAYAGLNAIVAISHAYTIQAGGYEYRACTITYASGGTSVFYVTLAMSIGGGGGD